MTAEPLSGIPDAVIVALRTALDRLSQLQVQRSGMHRLGLGDRYDDSLDTAGADSLDTVREFATLAPGNGVDPAPALYALAMSLDKPVYRESAVVALVRLKFLAPGVRVYRVELSNKCGGGRATGNLYGVGVYYVHSADDIRRGSWALPPQDSEEIARNYRPEVSL